MGRFLRRVHRLLVFLGARWASATEAQGIDGDHALNNRQLLKLLRGGITAEERREVAYHEAGHIAIRWMFRELSRVKFIDMRCNLEARGPS